MKLSDAIFSDDQLYRYVLWRIWDKQLPMINIIGLNPATADSVTNDPTMRRCISFAKFWGYGGFYMTNLFAFRTAYPKKLFEAEDPIGNHNDFWVNEIASRVNIVVLAWGVKGSFRERDKEIFERVKEKAFCIDVTQKGYPKHPLYLKSNINLKKYPF